MKYLTLSIPGPDGKPMQIDSGLPTGVPTGGLFDPQGNAGTGINAIWIAVELFLLGAVLLSLYQIIRGGINISSSSGDKEKFANGRERLRYGIIGLIVVFASFLLVNVLGKIFGINLLPL